MIEIMIENQALLGIRDHDHGFRFEIVGPECSQMISDTYLLSTS